MDNLNNVSYNTKNFIYPIQRNEVQNPLQQHSLSKVAGPVFENIAYSKERKAPDSEKKERKYKLKLTPINLNNLRQLKKKRDGDGNILTKFAQFHSHRLNSSISNFGFKTMDIITGSDDMDFLGKKDSLSLMHPFSQHPSTRGIPIPSFMPIVKHETSVSKMEEMGEIQEAFTNSVIDSLMRIMTNKKQEFNGVWYPTDLKKYYVKNKQEMPIDYWTGFANPEYFNKTGRFTFELKEGKLASKAVNALLEGLSVLDCGNSTQLAYYKAILDVIGPEKFDFVFSGTLNLKITQSGITDKNAPISYFADYTETSKKRLEGKVGERPVKVGEECHFKGIEWYGNKHGNGFDGGWNVVCIGKNESQEQLFIGHGLNKAMTEREINKLLVEGYNKERTPEEQEFILLTTDSRPYDRKINQYLKNFYTIPLELVDKMVSGFLIGSCRGLSPENILLAKEEELKEILILKLPQKC